MDPFTFFPTDIQQVLCAHLSNKTLSMFMSVSRRMQAFALGEAARRYFYTRDEYEKVLEGIMNIGELTRDGAYLFLARPGVKKLKLENAAYSRDMDMIMLALETGATDYSEGCMCAVRLGEYDIAMMLYEKMGKETVHSSSHNPIPITWNTRCVSEFLDAAYNGGNRDLINYFIALESPPDWNRAVKGAFWGGRVDLIEEIFDKYTGPVEDLINGACFGRNPIAATTYLIEKKIITTDNVLISRVMSLGCQELVDLMLAKFPRVDTADVFIAACDRGALKFVQELMPGNQRQIRKGFKAACKSGRTRVMVELAELISVDWNKALADVYKCLAVKKRTIYAILLCVLKGASVVDADIRALEHIDYERIITEEVVNNLKTISACKAKDSVDEPMGQ
jgi:hypothetical protein